MDEYQLEIQSIRSTLTRLRADEADPELIEEYEFFFLKQKTAYEVTR